MLITDELVLLWFVEREEKLAKSNGISILQINSFLKTNPEKIKDLIKLNFLEISMQATIYFKEPVIISSLKQEAQIFFDYYKKYFLEKG